MGQGFVVFSSAINYLPIFIPNGYVGRNERDFDISYFKKADPSGYGCIHVLHLRKYAQTDRQARTLH